MDPSAIVTPDQRVRVFLSSTLNELAEERAAARRAIERVRLTPVMFEIGARPYPPRSLYLAYLRQSHVFVGIYGDQYGWIAPDMTVSGLEDELQHAGDLPQLLYVKAPAPARDPRLRQLLADLPGTSYKHFSTAAELEALVADDLAVVLTESFMSRAPASAAPVRVPRPTSELVGRQAEIAEVAELVTGVGVRLVTLTGPGGIGKTRLAIAVTEVVADRFPDGVSFVSLAARSPDDFLEAIVPAVGLKDMGQQPLAELLADHLSHRNMLLVLDNFEHIVSAAPEVGRLIEGTRALRVLVTSRTALRLTGEEEYPVPPLAVPRVTGRLQEVLRAEATQLLCRRVAAVRHGYHPAPEEAVALARICRRLDGLPLALELVAARAHVMSIGELAARLDTVLDLSARSPDVPARQRTLRQTMDWSHAQLSPAAAEVFAQLGVFSGSFSLGAAEAVCAGEQRPDLLELLAELVDHSLLRPQLDGTTGRFSMLHVMREYARSLLGPEQVEAVSNRHADYYRRSALAAYTGLRGTAQRATLAQLDLDADNMAAALDWLLEHDRRTEVADMCWSLWIYYWLRNSMTEGRRWTSAALAAPGLPDLQRGRLLAADGILATWRGDYRLAHDEVQEALDIATRVDDADLKILANILLVVVVGGLGRRDAAEAFAESAISQARRRGDRWAEAVALCGLCWVLAASATFDRRQSTFERMLTAAIDSGDPLIYAMALDNVAEMRMWQGRVLEAAGLARDSVVTLAELRMTYASLGSLHTTAELLSRTGDWTSATRVQAAADHIAVDSDVSLWPPWTPRRDLLLHAAREHLGPAEYDEAVHAGRQWSLDTTCAEVTRALARITQPGTGVLAPERTGEREATSDSM